MARRAASIVAPARILLVGLPPTAAAAEPALPLPSTMAAVRNSIGRAASRDRRLGREP